MKIKLVTTVFFLAMLSTFALAQDKDLKKALSLINEGKADEAIAILTKEAAAKPDSFKTNLALGMAYDLKGDYSSAKAFLRKTLSYKPDSVHANYSLAMIYEKEKNYPLALACWEKVSGNARHERLRALAEKHISQLEKIK